MSTILCFSVNMGCCVYINEEKMNINEFSKCLQYNKEWNIEEGLNTFRTHCIYIKYSFNKISNIYHIYIYIYSLATLLGTPC